MRLGLLHTVPALAPRFDDMLRARRPDATTVHAVDAELLAEAIRSGVGAEVSAAVAAHVQYLISRGADAVLVTCSSIGEATEAAAADAAVPVLRVDTAMAESAVSIAAATGGRIAVLATLDATLGPTVRLLRHRAGGDVITVTADVVAGALEARTAGDTDRHDALISRAVAAAAERCDVIVLAQASMSQAADRADAAVPVLTSPELAVDAAIGLIEATRR